MDEVLQTALAGLINKVTQGAEVAGEFLVEETPEVLEQLLMWYGAYNFIYFLLGIVGIVLVPYLSINGMRKGTKLDKEDKSSPVGGFIFIGSVIGGVLGIAQTLSLLNLTWLKIWIAPKIWLIEYAATLTQKVTS